MIQVRIRVFFLIIASPRRRLKLRLDKILTERHYLKEETDCRDSDSEEAYYYCCESDDENSDLEIERNANTPHPLYPGASITVEDSILTIMKYALQPKIDLFKKVL